MASITVNFTPGTIGNHIIRYRNQAVGGAYFSYDVTVPLNEVNIPRSEVIDIGSFDIYCDQLVYECYILAECEGFVDASPIDGVPDAAFEFTVNINPEEDPCKLYELTYLNLTTTFDLNWDDLTCAGRSGVKNNDVRYDASIAYQNSQILCSSDSVINQFIVANPDWSAAVIQQPEKNNPGSSTTSNCHCVCYNTVTITNTAGVLQEVNYIIWNPGNADHLQITSEIIPAGLSITRDIVANSWKGTTASVTANFTVSVDNDCVS
jgi:hypothetical protein